MQDKNIKQPMRILQVLPALQSGGVERGTIDLAIALNHQGHVPFVLSEGGTLIEKLEQNNITHLSLKAASKNPFNIIRNAFILKHIIKKHHIEVIHARSRAPAWSAYLAAKMAKIPFVTTFHGTYNFSNGVKKWYNSVMARGDRVIAISPFIQEHIKRHYGQYVHPENISLIHRGVDLKAFTPLAVTDDRVSVLRQEWSIRPSHKVILVPGRLTRWKGQLVVLHALKKLVQKNPDVLCVFIGSSQGRTAYQKELQDFVDAHGLESHVRFVDHVKDMPAAYMLGHVVVHASTDPEAFGRVIIEAQAMGVPVVASNIGAPATTIKDQKTGFLHKAGDAKDLSKTIEKALSCDRNAITEQAFAEVKKHYTDTLLFEKTISIYKELMTAKKISQRKILVIRQGAFGDIVKSLGAFKAIKENHSQDNITLLTAPLFKAFCEKTGFFNTVLEDPRQRSLMSYFRITSTLHQQKFDLIYDLQGSKRTGRYFKLLSFRGPVQWSGNVKGATFYQPFSKKKELHPYERLADQLAIAGVDLKGQTALLPDLSWLNVTVPHDLPKRFFVMIPGSSPHTLEKRWPASFYGDTAASLKAHHIETVILGGAHDTPLAKIIQGKCPSALDLTGKTSFQEILGIAQQSLGIVGNDTGPLFLACASGKPTFVPWSEYCKAELNAPRGSNVHLIQEPVLQNLLPKRLWTEVGKSLP